MVHPAGICRLAFVLLRIGDIPDLDNRVRDRRLHVLFINEADQRPIRRRGRRFALRELRDRGHEEDERRQNAANQDSRPKDTIDDHV